MPSVARGDVAALVDSKVQSTLTVRISHHAVISPSCPQMALVSVPGKVNFFHDDGPICHLLNIQSSLVIPYCDKTLSPTSKGKREVEPLACGKFANAKIVYYKVVQDYIG